MWVFFFLNKIKIKRWEIYDEIKAAKWGDNQRTNEIPSQCNSEVRQRRLRRRDDTAELADPRRGSGGRAGNSEGTGRSWVDESAEWNGQRKKSRRKSPRRHRPRGDHRHKALQQFALAIHHWKLPRKSCVHQFVSSILRFLSNLNSSPKPKNQEDEESTNYVMI